MKTRSGIIALLILLGAFMGSAGAQVRNVVLVHGAWADGSSWAKVIPLLEKAGLNAVAVQNPLTSYEEDVAATKRAIALQDGPVTEAPEEEFWRAIKLDLYGTFLCSKIALPEIIKAGGGSVINMASNVALMALPGRDCYTAAKGGVSALTR